jgi:hypothetical protein
MATMLGRAAYCYAFFLWAKGLNAKGTHKEMFPVYGGKLWMRKTVHNWVENVAEAALAKQADL